MKICNQVIWLYHNLWEEDFVVGEVLLRGPHAAQQSEDRFTAQDRFVAQDKLVATDFWCLAKIRSLTKTECVEINGQRVPLSAADDTRFWHLWHFCLFFAVGVCAGSGGAAEEDEASACTAKCCTLGFSQRLKCSVQDIWGRLPQAFAHEFD